MNNDYFNRNEKDKENPGTIKNHQYGEETDQSQHIEIQQQFQRPPFGPPQGPPFGPPPGQPQGPQFGPPQGPPFGPPFGPPQGQPQRPPVGPPTSAPPNFTPELPRMEGQPPFMEGQPFGGPSVQFGGPSVQFGGIFFRRPRNFRRCINRFTFIWLINGNSFWFYPVFVDRNFVEGFRWRRNRWEFDRINLNRILFFQCF